MDDELKFWSLVVCLVALLAFTGIMKGCANERASDEQYTTRYNTCVVMGGSPSECKLGAPGGR